MTLPPVVFTNQEGKKENLFPKKCFYEKGKDYIIDTVKDGRGTWSNETLEEVRKRYPTAEIRDINDACAEIDKADEMNLKLGQPKEIDHNQWWEMLEVLPPVNFTQTEAGTTFQMSELTKGDITACYIRRHGRYFAVNARTTTTHEQLIEMVSVMTN